MTIVLLYVLCFLSFTKAGPTSTGQLKEFVFRIVAVDLQDLPSLLYDEYRKFPIFTFRFSLDGVEHNNRHVVVHEETLYPREQFQKIKLAPGQISKLRINIRHRREKEGDAQGFEPMSILNLTEDYVYEEGKSILVPIDDYQNVMSIYEVKLEQLPPPLVFVAILHFVGSDMEYELRIRNFRGAVASTVEKANDLLPNGNKHGKQLFLVMLYTNDGKIDTDNTKIWIKQPSIGMAVCQGKFPVGNPPMGIHIECESNETAKINRLSHTDLLTQIGDFETTPEAIKEKMRIYYRPEHLRSFEINGVSDRLSTDTIIVPARLMNDPIDNDPDRQKKNEPITAYRLRRGHMHVGVWLKGPDVILTWNGNRERPHIEEEHKSGESGERKNFWLSESRNNYGPEVPIRRNSKGDLPTLKTIEAHVKTGEFTEGECVRYQRDVVNELIRFQSL